MKIFNERNLKPAVIDMIVPFNFPTRFELYVGYRLKEYRRELSSFREVEKFVYDVKPLLNFSGSDGCIAAFISNVGGAVFVTDKYSCLYLSLANGESIKLEIE